jgi:hypothetical protein
MALATRELLQTSPGNALSFEEKLGIIVDREWTDRDNRRLARRLKDAKLSTRASLENILCEPGRGIDKPMVRQFSTGQWVKSKHNVVVVGKTGTGKSYFGSALADAACRRGYRSLFFRVPRLLEELALARAAGEYGSLLGKLDQPTADENLARCAERSDHRRCHLRPPGAQRPRREARRTIHPKKERPPATLGSAIAKSASNRTRCQDNSCPKISDFEYDTTEGVPRASMNANARLPGRGIHAEVWP